MAANETLTARARGGDGEAWNEMVRLYTPMITGVILSRILRFQEAEDLVQETLLRATQNIGRLRDDARVGAWFYGIALNVVREYLRGRRGALPLPSGNAEPAWTEPPAASLSEDLMHCLRQLPLNLREFVVLRHIQGLSYREMAETTSHSSGSVGERLWKARQLLRECLTRKLGSLEGI